MNDKTFVDTNVLIYAHDIDAGPKHEIAKRIMRELWGERAGLLSAQVLQEFYVNVTRKIASPLSKVSARTVIDSYASWCIENTLVDISTAFRIEDESQIGFGRSELWANNHGRTHRQSFCRGSIMVGVGTVAANMNESPMEL